MYSPRRLKSWRGPDSSTSTPTPRRASSSAMMPPAAPAPTMHTSVSTRGWSVTLGLRPGVTSEIAATAGEGLVADDCPACGRAVVAADEILDYAHPEGPHLLGEWAEVLPWPHVRGS